MYGCSSLDLRTENGAIKIETDLVSYSEKF